MLNGVGTNISMAYTSKYDNKSTGDKMDIEFEIGDSEQNSLNKCGERQSELTEIYMNMLSENNSSLYNKLGQFTRNYTQTTKRGLLTTKQAEYQAPGKCEIFSLFCCPGFPKGHPLAHDFACKVYSEQDGTNGRCWKWQQKRPRSTHEGRYHCH